MRVESNQLLESCGEEFIAPEIDFEIPDGHYKYGFIIILLLVGIGGDATDYKKHLARTGILEKALLIESKGPTKAAFSSAIAKVQKQIADAR